MLVSSLRKSRPLNTWTGSQCFSETKERALIRWVRLAGRITAISVKRRGDWHSPSEPKDTCPVLKSLNRKATSGHIYDRHFPGLGDKKNEISRHRRRVSTRRVVFYDRQRFIATVHGKFGLLKIYCFKARIVKKNLLRAIGTLSRQKMNDFFSAHKIFNIAFGYGNSELRKISRRVI